MIIFLCANTAMVLLLIMAHMISTVHLLHCSIMIRYVVILLSSTFIHHSAATLGSDDFLMERIALHTQNVVLLMFSK